MIDWKYFGSLVKQKIDESGYSLRKLERVSGTDHAAICRITQGKPCKVESYLQLCDIFHIDPYAPWMQSRNRIILIDGSQKDA